MLTCVVLPDGTSNMCHNVPHQPHISKEKDANDDIWSMTRKDSLWRQNFGELHEAPSASTRSNLHTSDLLCGYLHSFRGDRFAGYANGGVNLTPWWLYASSAVCQTPPLCRIRLICVGTRGSAPMRIRFYGYKPTSELVYRSSFLFHSPPLLLNNLFLLYRTSEVH